MSRIILDDAVRDKLIVATGCAELCDSAGNVIGYFTPKAVGPLEPQISEAEIKRRQAETEVYTFDEVMDHLRSL